jgi:hypothetical protein
VGELPVYYSDAPNDYRNINAAFAEEYSSRSRERLLSELRLSMAEFDAYIASLPASELAADHGVMHYSGQRATISKIIGSLAGDYEHHTRQIGEWVRSQ